MYISHFLFPIFRFIPSSVKKYPTIAPIKACSNGDIVYDATNIVATVAENHPTVITIATNVLSPASVVMSTWFDRTHPTIRPRLKRTIAINSIVVVIGVTILVYHGGFVSVIKLTYRSNLSLLVAYIMQP